MIYLHNKTPKPPYEALRGLIILFFIVIITLLTGCSERPAWKNIGYHSTITKSGLAGGM